MYWLRNKKNDFQFRTLIWGLASFLTFISGAQKSRLIERVLLSTRNIYFGGKIKKLILCYTL